MAKTKKNNKRAKSRKVKRGGRKNNTALKMSQMVGGQTPAPAPASRLNLDLVEEQSVIDALQSFGEAARELKSAIGIGKDTVTSLSAAVTAQGTAFTSLEASVNSLDEAITKPATGLYSKIIKNGIFNPRPQPAAAPAPRPVPAP